VVCGAGTATVGKKKIKVRRESLVEIPVKKIHRLYNTGKAPLVVG